MKTIKSALHPMNLATLFLLLISSQVLIAQTSYSPARFSNDPQSLQNRFNLEELEEDIDIIIRCFAQVGQTGRMSAVYCVGRDETNSRFFRDILRAARGSQLVPARVDGTEVNVSMFMFTVRIIKQGEDQGFLLYPHHTHNWEAFGESYSAAQRYGVHRGADCDARTDRFGDQNARMVYSVSEDGSTGEEIVAVDEIFADCVSAYSSFISTSIYIPAHAGGEPVETTVVEWFIKKR